MAKEYARCESGGCERGSWPGKRRGSSEVTPENKVYRAVSVADPNDCKGTCACFVVAQHVQTEDEGPKVTEEKAYIGNTKEDGDPGLLDEATRLAKHPGKTDKGGKPKDFWQILPACLQVDKKGEPKLALAFELV